MCTFTDTFNRDDIRRVYASFAADYKIVAEWTGLHSPADVASNIAEIKAIAEEQYLKEVHCSSFARAAPSARPPSTASRRTPPAGRPTGPATSTGTTRTATRCG